MTAVRFRKAADREVVAAYQWYRDRDAGDAAERLLAELEAAVVRLQQFAETFAVVHVTPTGKEVRRLRLKKFPYALHYFIETTGGVSVIAFSHVRRAKYWARRVR